MLRFFQKILHRFLQNPIFCKKSSCYSSENSSGYSIGSLFFSEYSLVNPVETFQGLLATFLLEFQLFFFRNFTTASANNFSKDSFRSAWHFIENLSIPQRITYNATREGVMKSGPWLCETDRPSSIHIFLIAWAWKQRYNEGVCVWCLVWYRLSYFLIK